MGSNDSPEISRRALIKAAAGLGAGAAVGLPAVVFLGGKPGPGRQANGQSSATSAANEPVLTDQPIVAYVRDASTGEVVVMFGAQETVIHDRALVARLAGVAQG